jgi:hypothetical protein
MNHNRPTMAALSRFFLALIAVCALASSLSAAPMVYTGLVVTDVRVGTTLIHNASLKITFEGDTNDILAVQVPSQECSGTPFSFLAKGVARIEIEFGGHTRRARLQDGQVFVALDQCNGGIGFGSFLGPNGLEPAYPMALTLGTAEYTAISDGAPLVDRISVTGAAWSCIGYPPLGDDGLPETPTGNCIPPDTYPIKSDIGDIFIYQPYSESEIDGSIFSNHSGSTNRSVFLVRPQAIRTAATTRASDDSHASGIVYTLQTVADGWIGNHAFNQALVTFRMVSNAKSVTTQPSPVDPTKPLYENRSGFATVTIDDGYSVITAQFAPRQVYVRYDTGAGVAGFGSQISPTYPIALNCANTAYPSDSSYTVDCDQGEAWDYLNIDDSLEIFHGGTLAQLSNPGSPSAGVLSLPQSLSQPTLLTGTAHTCAGVYTIAAQSDPFPYFPGDLGVCAAPAPRGLHTSRGDLFLQDLEGGTLSLGTLAPPSGAGGGGGWDFANSGFLNVEVTRGDD